MTQLELVTKISEDLKINNEIIHFTVKQLCDYYKITYSQFYYYKEVYPFFNEANKIRVDKRIPRKKKAAKNTPKVVNDYFSVKQHRSIAKKVAEKYKEKIYKKPIKIISKFGSIENIKNELKK